MLRTSGQRASGFLVLEVKCISFAFRTAGAHFKSHHILVAGWKSFGMLDGQLWLGAPPGHKHVLDECLFYTCFFNF